MAGTMNQISTQGVLSLFVQLEANTVQNETLVVVLCCCNPIWLVTATGGNENRIYMWNMELKQYIYSIIVLKQHGSYSSEYAQANLCVCCIDILKKMLLG